MGVRMRFREDGADEAERHARSLAGEKVYECDCDNPECTSKRVSWEKVPPSEPGDTWECHWYRPKGEPQGPIAGYIICCPRCRKLHYWTSANNCGSKRKLDGGGWTCDHSGKSSCWTWTGSPRDGTLTGSPSLFANGEGHCGWHGHLRNGEMVE